MATKLEMQAKHRRVIKLAQELSLRSPHFRRLLQLMIDEVTASLSPSPPRLKECWNLEDLLAGETEASRKGIQRIFFRHGPEKTNGKKPSEGGRDRLVFWTPEGARARGAFDEGLVHNFKITQSMALWLGRWAVRKLNREVQSATLRDALRISESSWSNGSTSLSEEKVLGIYRLDQDEIRGKTYFVPHPPEVGLDDAVAEVFGDRLLGLVGADGYNEPAPSFSDIFEPA